MIKNVIQSIRNSSNIHRDKTALIDGDLKFTYSDIEDMSNKVCKYLSDRSVGKECVVVVYMDRSYLSVVTILGVLKAGAAFLPIDLKTPVKRVEFMARISKAKCIIVDNDDNKHIENFSLSSVNIYDILSHGEADYYTDEVVKDDQLAYILFTSGSTGLPKGAMIEHGGMNNHLSEKIRILNLSEESVVSHNASISFDVSIWQMLAPLCVGATIVIFPEKLTLNLRGFLDILCEQKVSVLEVVPTYLSLLLNEMKNYSGGFTNLKYLISTGEVLIKNLVEQCFDVLPDVILINAYGPTEASDDIMHHIIEKNNNYDKTPIGKPINNVEISIVKSDGKLCDVNEIGELWVRGICVGRGYIGNDTETKLNFLFDSCTNTRTYKTGDLVWLGDDGNYYFYDRMDMQIAFHGKRVEIKEIENTMLKYAGIYASAVIYDSENQQINAYYVSNSVIDVNKLKDFLKTLLPPHMIPTFINRIDKIPVNISGKTNYDKLKKLHNLPSENTDLHGYSPEESKLLKIVMDVVGINQLPDNDYWKVDTKIIGYNSINAIRLVLKIEETFDIEIEYEKLTPEILFNYNELRKLVGCS